MMRMRTDELRTLLERYPNISRTELRYLRRLYSEASATDIIAIKSSELGAKAREIDPSSDQVWNRVVMAGVVLVALVALSLAFQSF